MPVVPVKLPKQLKVPGTFVPRGKTQKPSLEKSFYYIVMSISIVGTKPLGRLNKLTPHLLTLCTPDTSLLSAFIFK